MILRMHKESAFNKSFGLFLESLPKAEEMLSAEMYTDELLKMMQTPALEDLVRSQRTVAEQVYNGTYYWHRYTPLKQLLGDKAPSVEQFSHFSSLVSLPSLSSSQFTVYRLRVLNACLHSAVPSRCPRKCPVLHGTFLGACVHA